MRRARPAPAARGGGLLLVGHWHGHVRTVLGDQDGGVHAEFLCGPRRHLLQPHPLFGPADFSAVCGVHHAVQVSGEGPDPRPDLFERFRPALAGLLGRFPAACAVASDSLIRASAISASGGHGPGDLGLPCPQPAPGHRGLGCPALPGRRPGQGVRPASDRPQALLGGPDLEPGVGLGFPGRAGLRGQAVPVRTVHVLRHGWLAGLSRVVLALGLGELGAESFELGERAFALRGDRGDRRLQPGGFLLGRPRRAGQTAKPPGGLRRGLVRGPHSGQRLTHGRPVPLLVGDRVRPARPRPTARHARLPPARWPPRRPLPAWTACSAAWLSLRAPSGRRAGRRPW